MMAFNIALKVPKYFGFLCNKICHQELSKLAQSGHTAMPLLSSNLFPLLQLRLIFLKMGQPWPLFQTNNKIAKISECGKMSCPSSIWRWDSNPQPLKHESSPITTRPWLPPSIYHFFPFLCLSFFHSQPV